MAFLQYPLHLVTMMIFSNADMIETLSAPEALGTKINTLTGLLWISWAYRTCHAPSCLRAFAYVVPQSPTLPPTPYLSYLYSSVNLFGDALLGPQV